MQAEVELTTHMILMLSLLGGAVFLFVSDVLRIDVCALLILVALGIIASIPGNESILDLHNLFIGFSSNAVISIIAVMIIGAGLDKTGIMTRLAGAILKYGGSTENRLILWVCGTVGLISSFLQNVGAAALFIPVVSRISARSGIPMSRLLIPMGFCAILGGTITMVGSSPLILLNDLISNFNAAQPADRQVETFSMFAVTPIGLALVAAGIVYFVLGGKFVLPAIKSGSGAKGLSTAEYLNRVYGLDVRIYEVAIPQESSLHDISLNDVQLRFGLRIIAERINGKLRMSPLATDTLKAGSKIAVIANAEQSRDFSETYGLELSDRLEVFQDLLAATNGGICEIVLPPDSDLIGKTIVDLRLRQHYGISVMVVHRAGESLMQYNDLPFQAGDTLVAYSNWKDLARLESDSNFIVVTTEYPKEELRPRKTKVALLFFCIAMALVLFTDMRLSLALLTGALGMILGNVLKIDEAYQAISWPTVFLLASLIPLGQAVQLTGNS